MHSGAVGFSGPESRPPFFDRDLRPRDRTLDPHGLTAAVRLREERTRWSLGQDPDERLGRGRAGTAAVVLGRDDLLAVVQALAGKQREGVVAPRSDGVRHQAGVGVDAEWGGTPAALDNSGATWNDRAGD